MAIEALATINCSRCQKLVVSTSVACPHCGMPVAQAKRVATDSGEKRGWFIFSGSPGGNIATGAFILALGIGLNLGDVWVFSDRSWFAFMAGGVLWVVVGMFRLGADR